MIKIIACVITFCLMTLSPVEKTTILFFGDSITQAGVREDGYITQLQGIIDENEMSENAELIGKGIGGNKVYDLYLRMQEDCIAHNPDIVVLYIGVNDVWHKQSHGTGTDADKFVRFYQAIIDSLQARNIDLILCTPGVIGEKTDFSNALDGDLNQYTKFIKELAVKNNTGLCDLRGEMLAFNKANNPENKSKGILTSDSVHLNKKGNHLVATTLWGMLKQKL